MPHPNDALDGLTVLERGWLSSNNLLIHAVGDEPGAVLVDTSHVNHVGQTLALVRHALRGQPLATLVNTHLHSDHCGGNAVLQREFGAALLIPPGQAEAVANWDDGQLSHQATGQRCDRFAPQGLLRPGEVLRAGGRRWEVLHAPGHDPDSVMLFDAQGGVLVSADALWEHGFGLVFPELVGEPGFDDVASVLDAIERLPVRVVVPGHGAPFTDVAAALARARTRLQGYVAEPARHARHAAKVLIKYHLMEEHRQALVALRDWTAAAPLFAALWELHGRHHSASPHDWCDVLVADLAGSGALVVEDGVVVNR